MAPNNAPGKIRLKGITFALLVLIGIALPQPALAACGYAGVAISGTVEELADACRALEDVLDYFRKIGFRPEPVVSISFQDQVHMDMYPHVYEPAGKEAVGRSEVSGSYNFRLRELQITTGRRELPRERRP